MAAAGAGCIRYSASARCCCCGCRVLNERIFAQCNYICVLSLTRLSKRSHYSVCAQVDDIVSSVTGKPDPMLQGEWRQLHGCQQCYVAACRVFKHVSYSIAAASTPGENPWLARCCLHLTSHTSHPTPHTSHLTLHLTPHTSHLTPAHS